MAAVGFKPSLLIKTAYDVNVMFLSYPSTLIILTPIWCCPIFLISQQIDGVHQIHVFSWVEWVQMGAPITRFFTFQF